MKALRSEGMNVRGPPQNSILGSMVHPCDRVTTVCTATAWNMEAAISALLTFLLMRFCTSVLEKTPQREAMWYMFSDREANSSMRSTSTREAWPSGL